jgi:rhodanese-related sulfurtransferase
MIPEAASVSMPSALGEISREELVRRLQDPALTIIDALPPESYETAHIPGAINLPVLEIEECAAALLPDRAAEIVVYCAAFT